MSVPGAIVIAGPTASGKSSLALRLAERDDGVVINADALQVYSCWRVLTARPDAADLARAPHRLYGTVGADQRHSVGAWLRDLAPVLEDCARTNRRPILVGGSGLYLGAALEGLADVPAIPPEVRALSDAMLRDGAVGAMLGDLAVGDPVGYARMDRANPMRVQRAWDVLKATGRALSDWQRGTSAPLIAAESAVRIVLAPDKDALNRAIARRFEAMVCLGALEECAAFAALGLPAEVPSARALGAPELMAYLRGETGLVEATEAAITATRQFAKRQRTWFRNRMKDWLWFDPAEDVLARIRPR